MSVSKYNINELPKDAGANILQWVNTFEEVAAPMLKVIERKAKRYAQLKDKLAATPANAPAKKYYEAELRELKEDITDLHNTHKLALAQIESMCIAHYLEYKAIVDYKNEEYEQMAQAYDFAHGMATKLLEEKQQKKTQYSNTLNIAA